MNRWNRFLSVLVVSIVVLPTPAYAYIDPGAGSLILQLLLGGVAGLIVVGKLFWSNIRATLFGVKREQPLATSADTSLPEEPSDTIETHP